jgi:hypothetical protein
MKMTEMDLFDEVFTHVSEVDGAQTSYNVTALYAHIIAHELDPAILKVTVPVDAEHAQYCVEHRGVEQDRLKVLLDHPEYLKKPAIFIAMADGSHLLVDGTHRYVMYYYAKLPNIPAYIVPEAMASPFVIEDLPAMPEDILMEWSGLSLLRKLREQ